jgi:hypothetical protein
MCLLAISQIYFFEICFLIILGSFIGRCFRFFTFRRPIHFVKIYVEISTTSGSFDKKTSNRKCFILWRFFKVNKFRRKYNHSNKRLQEVSISYMNSINKVVQKNLEYLCRYDFCQNGSKTLSF